MSKPRYGWWGYAKYIIRVYPARKQEYDALHQQSITANLSGMPGSREASRGTEEIAVRELPDTKQREFEAVRRAIQATERMANGEQRLRIIDLVYWKRSHTLDGAALAVGYSYDRARQIHGEFIRLVAAKYGLMDDESNGKTS